VASQLAITIDDDQRLQLEALAAASSATPAELAAHAIAEYLADDAEFRRAVAEGLAAADAGDVVDYRPYMADLRRRMAAREAG
jgi:predicted transcriptional regulator